MTQQEFTSLVATAAAGLAPIMLAHGHISPERLRELAETRLRALRKRSRRKLGPGTRRQAGQSEGVQPRAGSVAGGADRSRAGVRWCTTSHGPHGLRQDLHKRAAPQTNDGMHRYDERVRGD